MIRGQDDQIKVNKEDKESAMNLPPELAQWLGFTESSILLQDGLLRLADLVQVPSEALQQLDKEAQIQQILREDFNEIFSPDNSVKDGNISHNSLASKLWWKG